MQHLDPHFRNCFYLKNDENTAAGRALNCINVNALSYNSEFTEHLSVDVC